MYYNESAAVVRVTWLLLMCHVQTLQAGNVLLIQLHFRTTIVYRVYHCHLNLISSLN